MTAFDAKNVAAAIARITSTGTKDLRALRERAVGHGLDDLVAACDSELSHRPLELTGDQAADHERMAREVDGLGLQQTVVHAFTKGRPPSDDERSVIRWLAANPGGSHEQLTAHHGKRDVGLLIGHLVYDRYGCFRQFMTPGEAQSEVLLRRDKSQKSVRYWLKPEAEAAFAQLGLT